MRRSKAEIEAALGLASEATKIAREAVAATSGAMALIETLGRKIDALPLSEVLSSDELAEFARVLPQWRVTCGVADGTSYKSYRRHITEDELTPERQESGALSRDTYLTLADGEYSDYDLAKIFDTYSYSGTAYGGGGYAIEIFSTKPGPITYEDFARVLDAEAYLVSAGYIRPVETETAEV
jgi:hypothetical protein